MSRVPNQEIHELNDSAFDVGLLLRIAPEKHVPWKMSVSTVVRFWLLATARFIGDNCSDIHERVRVVSSSVQTVCLLRPATRHLQTPIPSSSSTGPKHRSSSILRRSPVVVSLLLPALLERLHLLFILLVFFR